MNKNALLGTAGKRQLVKSGLTFLLGFFAILLVVFITIVWNDFSGWQNYFRNELPALMSLLVSIFFLFAVTFFYFYFEDIAFLAKARNSVLVFTLLAACTLICYLFGKYVHLYARPLALFALLCLFLISRRHALFLNVIFAFLTFVMDMFTNAFPAVEMSEQIYASLMLTFISGTLAVFIAGEVKTRAKLIFTGIVIAVPTVVVILLFKIPQLSEEGWIAYVAAAGYSILGSVVSAILALAILPVFEWMFNNLTVFRLRELTSTNAPLLVRLKTEAPGTFNHSLIVAQLAETCAVAIGENAELARAAAYYHDVGKLKQPDCFTENQSDYNLHDEITPELSADIIRSHTQDGYDLLTASHLPRAIAEVALQHHGTLPIKYFYDKAVRLSGDANVKDFSYLGPLPQTRIAAIIMISDAAEAATRATANRSPENVERTCRAIIEERMDLGQFDECDITMRELTVIKQTLVEALSGIHHHRVEYPAIRFNRDRQAVREEVPRDK